MNEKKNKTKNSTLLDAATPLELYPAHVAAESQTTLTGQTTKERGGGGGDYFQTLTTPSREAETSIVSGTEVAASATTASMWSTLGGVGPRLPPKPATLTLVSDPARARGAISG